MEYPPKTLPVKKTTCLGLITCLMGIGSAWYALQTAHEDFEPMIVHQVSFSPEQPAVPESLKLLVAVAETNYDHAAKVGRNAIEQSLHRRGQVISNWRETRLEESASRHGDWHYSAIVDLGDYQQPVYMMRTVRIVSGTAASVVAELDADATGLMAFVEPEALDAAIWWMEGRFDVELAASVDPVDLHLFRLNEVSLDNLTAAKQALSQLTGVTAVDFNHMAWTASSDMPRTGPDLNAFGEDLSSPVELMGANDPGYTHNWQLKIMNAEGGWQSRPQGAVRDNGKRMVIGIVDTGADLNNPDLSFWVNSSETFNNKDTDGNGFVDDVHGWNFYSRNGNVHIASGHGPTVANIAGSRTNNGIGSASPAGDVDLMIVVYASPSGAGNTFAALEGFMYLVRNGANVINCSIGTAAADSWRAVLDWALPYDVLVFAAAGNSNQDLATNPAFPASARRPNLVAVGSSDGNDRKNSHSNYGKNDLHFFAPGTSTSFATPIAASLAALVWAQFPEYNYAQVRDRIMATVDKLPSYTNVSISGGRINAGKALFHQSVPVTPVVSIPVASSGLTASAVSSSQINLGWTDKSNNEDGFRIERSPNGSSGWTVIGTVAANATVYQNTGLTAATTYHYRVSAYNSAGAASSGSISATTTTSQQLPVAPSGLSASAVSSSQINLAWIDKSNNENGFRIERSLNGSSGWTEIGTVAANATTYQNTGLIAATSYHYRIQAYNSVGNSGYSANSSMTTQSQATGSGGSGTVVREWWTGITGTTVGSLTGNAKYPNNPTGSDTLTSLRAVSWNNPSQTSNWADNYGQRIRGYIVAPATGAYTFWISSDDSSELWLSTGSDPANRKLIASVPGWANVSEWNKFAAQKSAIVHLQAGTAYYVEILHKDGVGGDNLAVGWLKPGQTGTVPSEIVPGSVLSSSAEGFSDPEEEDPWMSVDIGSPAFAGSAVMESPNSFTVAGAGADIWGTADSFHYAYLPITGDAEIVARVVSLTNTHTWAKAGVMIRESLTANSKHAMMVVSPSSGASFQRRVTTGGISFCTTQPGHTAPTWVSIVREGDLFTAYRSSNGDNWILVGSAVIPMSQTVYIGLAVTSHNAGVLTTAAFDDVWVWQTTP